MSDALKRLLTLLNVEPVADDFYRGESQDLGFRRVFGGQVLGQAAVAACNTVAGRAMHSLHAYFLRTGDASAAIEYEVQRIRDGRSFASRRVIARQHGKEILTLTASFQTPEPGFSHQFDMPTSEGPDGLWSELETRRKFAHLIPESVREQLTADAPIEIRPVKPLNYLDPDVRPPHKCNWFRAAGQMPDDDVMHRCVLTYASDFGLLGASLQPHGVTFWRPDMQVASLDHAVWFHRPLRADDWLLYVMDSPSASQARGFNRGSIYNQRGQLVASVAQEGLIRYRGEERQGDLKDETQGTSD